MVHTNRKKNRSGTPRKPKIVHTKRREVLDDEGWVHIVDKPSTKPAPNVVELKDESKELWALAADFKIGNCYYVDRTIEELLVEYDRARKSWGKCEACRQLKIFCEEKTSADNEGVKKVVCLGLGSLQNARGEGRKASFGQLVGLLSLLENLGKEGMEIIFQDPAFTALDKQFLTSLSESYSVLETPEAFAKVTVDTMVYAIHCYADIYSQISTQEPPAVLIGTNMDKFEMSSEVDESTGRTLKAMVEGYEKSPFPQIRSDFSDTIIYWGRRSTEEAGVAATPAIEEVQGPEAKEEDAGVEAKDIEPEPIAKDPVAGDDKLEAKEAKTLSPTGETETTSTEEQEDRGVKT
ncbi:hypothetical protein BJ875DRAFT_467987 [Amylocarpus encephaloides]|uniref:SRR1-like domain-containing protein n=1 Tax=Amylocarpus encephaloides TaxID=45428 RepID=A0A9P8C3F6_9HELO|nr:hypothetical protein BJ875DRAFT_467987 [Amylocarpus encephaloides]